MNAFKNQFKIYKTDQTKALKTKVNQKNVAKQREEDIEKVKLKQTKRKYVSRTKKRAENEYGVKLQQTE